MDPLRLPEPSKVCEYDFDNRIKVTIAEGVQNIEAMKILWMELHMHSKFAMEFFLAFHKTTKKEIQPALVLLSNSDIPKTIILCMISNKTIPLEIKKKVLTNKNVRALSVLGDGLAGDFSFDTCSIFLSAISQYSRNKKVAVISFEKLPLDSNFYAFCRAYRGVWLTNIQETVENQYRMTVPSSMELFYKSFSKNRRKKFRNTQKRLKNKLKNRTSIRVFNKESDVIKFCEDAARISRNSWQYEIGKAFLDDSEMRRRLSLFAENGWLLGYIMYIDDTPCAFEGGMVIDDVYYAIYCGYDKEYMRYSLGTALMLHAIEKLSQQAKIKFYDFGLGYSEYKNVFCDIQWQVSSFNFYKKNARGLIYYIIFFVSNLLKKFDKLSSSILDIRIALKERIGSKKFFKKQAERR